RDYDRAALHRGSPVGRRSMIGQAAEGKRYRVCQSPATLLYSLSPPAPLAPGSRGRPELLPLQLGLPAQVLDDRPPSRPVPAVQVSPPKARLGTTDDGVSSGRTIGATHAELTILRTGRRENYNRFKCATSWDDRSPAPGRRRYIMTPVT